MLGTLLCSSPPFRPHGVQCSNIIIHPSLRIVTPASCPAHYTGNTVPSVLPGLSFCASHSCLHLIELSSCSLITFLPTTLFPTAGRVLEFPRPESLILIIRCMARGALPACMHHHGIGSWSQLRACSRSPACITLTQNTLCTVAKQNSESCRDLKFSTAINTTAFKL